MQTPPLPTSAPPHRLSNVQPPGDRNLPGRFALGFGLAVVACAVVMQFVAQAIPSIAQARGLSAREVGMLFTAGAAVEGLLGIIALVCGLVGLFNSSRSRGAAAAGVALGGQALLLVGVKMAAVLMQVVSN